MWSDDINKKMREAGDGDNFPFDENSWEKMEVLLDKHLPQKKKRRILFFILLSFSLLSIPAIMLTRENGTKKKDISTSTTSRKSIKKNDDKNNELPSDPYNFEPNKSILANTDTASRPIAFIDPSHNDKNSIITILNKPAPRNTSNYIEQIDEFQPITLNRTSSILKNPGNANNENSIANKSTSPLIVIPSTNTTTIAALPYINPNARDTSNILQKKSVIAGNKSSALSDTISLATESKKNKTASATRRKFGINFSIGPDMSSVIKNSAGKVEAKYGLGFSYELTKKLFVRTGFFVSRKIYSADSAAYHPDPVFWTYYSNLQKVDANCLVYEMPVSISYMFLSRKKNSAFLSTGLSSYFMKKETYKYSYKDALGGPQTHVSVYNNENKHLFSNLTLSAGFRHRFNDRLALITEPYTQIPVKGVGAGKVKLNSAGIIITIDYKPFGKK